MLPVGSPEWPEAGDVTGDGAGSRAAVPEGGRAMVTRPIVVGADGSEESLRAVEWAATEAARRAVSLRIVAVTRPGPGPR